MAELILVVNPKAESTKIAVYKTIVTATRVCESCTGIPSQVPTEYGVKAIFAKDIVHSAEELAAFSDIPAQAGYRHALIEKALTEEGAGQSDLVCVVCRSGSVGEQIADIINGIVGAGTAQSFEGATPHVSTPHPSATLTPSPQGEGCAVSCGLASPKEGVLRAYVCDPADAATADVVGALQNGTQSTVHGAGQGESEMDALAEYALRILTGR